MWWLFCQYFMNLWCAWSGGLGLNVGLVWACLWTDHILPTCWEQKHILDTLRVYNNYNIRQNIWLPAAGKSCRILVKMQVQRDLLSPTFMVLCPGFLKYKCIKYNVGKPSLMLKSRVPYIWFHKSVYRILTSDLQSGQSLFQKEMWFGPSSCNL